MCEITSGFARACDTPGGIEIAYAWSIPPTGSAYATLTYAAGSISAMTLQTGKYAYPIRFEVGTSKFNDKAIGTTQASSYGREQTGQILVAGNTATMIDNIEEIGKGRVAVAVKLNDDTFEVFFLDNGAKVMDERDTGVNYEDFNGNTLNFTGKEKHKAMKVDAAIILAMLGTES